MDDTFGNHVDCLAVLRSSHARSLSLPCLSFENVISPREDGRMPRIRRTRNSGSSKEGTMLPRMIVTLVVVFVSGRIIAAPPVDSAGAGAGAEEPDTYVTERFPGFSLPAPGALGSVPPVAPTAWNTAERAAIKECAPGTSDEDLALWRLPRDGWIVVATADERLCVCAPHEGAPVLVAMHRIDFGGCSIRGVAGPGIDAGDVDGNGTLDMVLHWGSGGCGLAANIGNDTVVLLEPARSGAAASVRFLPL